MTISQKKNYLAGKGGVMESEKYNEIREKVRNIVSEQIRDGSMWSVRGKSDSYPINYGRSEYVKVIQQLREILRVPEGENIITHAKVVRVLADGLLALQK